MKLLIHTYPNISDVYQTTGCPPPPFLEGEGGDSSWEDTVTVTYCVSEIIRKLFLNLITNYVIDLSLNSLISCSCKTGLKNNPAFTIEKSSFFFVFLIFREKSLLHINLIRLELLMNFSKGIFRQCL